ncbi:MAG TPA: IclR family transcriptional regulator C-terminal domain-containing protein [Burkholderiales bacterium]|jgi:IclR family pca regulon transcriptional regulator|nr:IclR family transcriptional regulator C-terminal domain-containing protein [Burkholderiales bacterium]
MDRLAFDRRDWIAGLEKGLRIIEAFNDINQRLTASTAARRTGITRTAARRYLHTLRHLGYLESDGHFFWLTPRVLRLGWSFLDSARLARTVQPHLQRISAAVGGAAYFAVLDEDDVIYVARDGSTCLRNVGFVLGAPVSPSVSSAGIALLSCCSGRHVNRWLARQRFVPFTPYTVTTREGMRALIESARRQGFALLEQQLEPKLRGLAVPIRAQTGRTIGAISASLAMEDESTAHAVARVLPRLREAAYSLLASL